MRVRRKIIIFVPLIIIIFIVDHPSCHPLIRLNKHLNNPERNPSSVRIIH